ncbi:MAG: histidinol dehydrogenase [Hyphomicrobiaceae bacterium]
MPQRLSTQDPEFEAAFAFFISLKREVSDDIDAAVREIIERVRTQGDRALVEYTAQFDRLQLTTDALRINQDELTAASAECTSDALDALKLAHQRVHAHHQRQRPESRRYQDEIGAELGDRWTPVDAAGLYVPGGLASYPSSVIMNAVPAKVAGVPRVVMVVPTPDGVINPLVLAAAHLAGVDEVYRVGGAQAVAALAYGTETINPVATIVGPGNAYVATAKRQVFGKVGIDSIAGPSEVLIIADADNDPEWIAADLLAQAEHDSAAQSILMTDNTAFADAVVAAVDRQLAALPRVEIARASWQDFGGIIILDSLSEAPPLADRLAAEHLQIATTNCEALANQISNAGAIFLGKLTPEVIGDYVAGTNHVLPTARSARFSSGLSVLDFMKRTSIIKLDAASLAHLATPAMTLARAEGLEAHRRSVEVRLKPSSG